MPTMFRFASSTAPRLQRRRAATVALLALLAPAGGWGQPPGPQAVRLRAGDGITVYPRGTEARLGAAGDGSSLAIDGLLVERGPGGAGAITRLCCSAGSTRSTTCTTERQITLGAQRTDVIGRYGVPQPGQPAHMTYKGIDFELDGQGRVVKICVVPH